MKNLKLLNKHYLSIILFYLFFGIAAQSQEPIDIWNIEEKKATENNDIIKTNKKKNITQNSIYKMQSQKNDEISIEEDQAIVSKKIKIVGLYDPAENGLDINMWRNSDGSKILNLFKKINKINLSKDASKF